MFHLPRCASVVTDDVDVQKFFRMLSSLDVNSKESLEPFLEKFGGVKFRVSGISESVAITGNDSQSSPDFEQFSIDLWKEYYIQEDVYQLGILEDKSPLEVKYQLTCTLKYLLYLPSAVFFSWSEMFELHPNQCG